MSNRSDFKTLCLNCTSNISHKGVEERSQVLINLSTIFYWIAKPPSGLQKEIGQIGKNSKMDSSLLELIKNDSQLPEHIFYNGQALRASECKNILLTGLTGQLGHYALKSLLKRPDTNIYCIVRTNSLAKAEQRVKATEIEKDYKGRTTLIGGDLSREHLGLDSDVYEELVKNMDAVVHCAVKSNHVQPYDFKLNDDNVETIRNANVFGTLRLIEFATTGKAKRILYASSLGAANRLTEEGNFSEELIEDNNFGDGLEMGYCLTKFVGEKLMTEAFRRGIQGLIIRFPMIVGENESGLFDITNNHMFYLITSYLQTGQKPVYMSAFPAVPVDTCADIAVDLFFNDDVPSEIFNLSNPHGAQYSDIRVVAERMGVEVKKAEFSTFIQTIKEQGEKSILHPFRRLYCQENAVEKIERSSLYFKLVFQENGAELINKCSKKFFKFVPNIMQIVDTPNNTIYKMLMANNAKKFLSD